MKTRLSTLAVILAFPTFVFADLPTEPPTITTSGSVELHVPADMADLRFEVHIREADLTAAREKQADRAAKVLAALRAAGGRRKICKPPK